jgi:hypothetical protein
MLIKLFLKYYECYPILVIKIHEDILHNLCWIQNIITIIRSRRLR